MHCHFTGYATDRWKSDLVGTKSWEEIVEKSKNIAKLHLNFGCMEEVGIKMIGQ